MPQEPVIYALQIPAGVLFQCIFPEYTHIVVVKKLLPPRRNATSWWNGNNITVGRGWNRNYNPGGRCVEMK